MTQNPDDDWILLSNRLLLLQEIMVGLSQLPFAEVMDHAASGVSWIFGGAALTSAASGALSPPPLIARGRALLDGYGEVYLAYFEGPPEPRYLLLSGVPLSDPQEFRLAALYFEHLVAALLAAGYREELARQARTDWLTGLGNRRSLAERLGAKPAADAAVSLLELRPPEGSTQAATDALLKEVAEGLGAWLPHDKVLRVGAYRFAMFWAEDEVPAGDVALAEGLVQGWAFQREVRARTLGALFEQAEVRLERALAARWSAPLPPQSPVPASAVRVVCGLPAAAELWQERVRRWSIDRAVTLLFDLPQGFALEALATLEREHVPVLLVTDSPSEPYLHDLRGENPEGMIVGTPSEEAMIDALRRTLAGSTFYEGPTLTEDGLYPRERTVLRHLARGSANTQIAEALGISEKTVANYVTSLQDKLFLNNRVELVLYYLGKLERS